MAELKTNPSDISVEALLDAIPDETRRSDCRTIAKLMEKLTGSKPQLWGASIVGFGTYHYRYASGREGDWFITGFAPRKNDLTLYILSGFTRFEDLMSRLGRHKTGKSCLYIRRLEDIDMKVLEELIGESVDHVRQNNASSSREGA